MPFSEHHKVDHPVSLYAATKKANGLMAHTYSHLFELPTTGLRFFTVYGPWDRPDMSQMLFASAILQGDPIKVFNQGNMLRDFTHIYDIVEGTVRVLDKPTTPNSSFIPEAPDPDISHAPYCIFNFGNSQPVPLLDYIHELENALGKTTAIDFLPMKAGDVPATAADTSELEQWAGFKPQTPLSKGLTEFASWFTMHYSRT
jgi:UDP-glucuronate 4-epimerase